MFSSRKDVDYFANQANDFITELIKVIRIANNNYVTFELINQFATQEDDLKELMKVIEKKWKQNLLKQEDEYNFLSAQKFIDNTWGDLKKDVKSIIVSEISNMTKPFINDERTKNTFCPTADEITFMGFKKAIEIGKIVTWKINATKEPALAKLVAAWMKLDCQAEVLNTIEKQDEEPIPFKRPKVIFCDEYQEYCTDNDADYLDKSRESRGIMVVATHSYSSMKIALNDTDGSKLGKLLSMFINKIFMRMDDVKYTIKEIIDQIGKVDKEKTSLNINETARNSNVNYFIRRIQGKDRNITTGISYQKVKEELFDIPFFNRGLTEGKAVCLISNGKVLYDPVVVHAPRQHIEGRIKRVGTRYKWVQLKEDVFGSATIDPDLMDRPLPVSNKVEVENHVAVLSAEPKAQEPQRVVFEIKAEDKRVVFEKEEAKESTMIDQINKDQRQVGKENQKEKYFVDEDKQKKPPQKVILKDNQEKKKDGDPDKDVQMSFNFGNTDLYN